MCRREWDRRNRCSGFGPAEPTPSPPGARVYFITDGSGHVKIGWAVNVGNRLAELQSGNPNQLILMASVPGGCSVERDLHRRFAGHRVRGEWFTLAPEIADFIEKIPAAKTKLGVARIAV